MPDEEEAKREHGIRIVENLAVGIQKMTDVQDQMIATQTGLAKQVKILNSQVSALNDMINALGPIMVEMLELLRETQMAPPDDDDDDEQQGDDREEDIRRVEEGLMAAFRSMRRGKRG